MKPKKIKKKEYQVIKIRTIEYSLPIILAADKDEAINLAEESTNWEIENEDLAFDIEEV